MCFAVAVLAPLFGADAKDDKAIAEATKKLQGTWSRDGVVQQRGEIAVRGEVQPITFKNDKMGFE